MKQLAFYGFLSALFALASGAIVDVHRLRASHQRIAPRSETPGIAAAAGKLQQNRSSAVAFQNFQQLLFAAPRCGVAEPTGTDLKERGSHCPASCPLYVQEMRNDAFCSFRCVEDSIDSCKSVNPHTPIPDAKLGSCRECQISGCSVCATDGTDTCLRCKEGMWLENGKCSNLKLYIWYGIFGIIAALAIFVCLWIWSLTKRAKQINNEDGMARGLHARSASKLLMPVDPNRPDEPRDFWPMDTNLTNEPIAGNAILHLFNFERVIILWAVCVAVAWISMGLLIDSDFFRVGTRSPGDTPRDNCIIIAWGFTTQQRIMYAKYIFVSTLYIVSFVGAILFAIRTLRFHQRLDSQRSTHKDYAAKVSGLPIFEGKDRKVEKVLTDKFEKITGQTVIGVSMCWDIDGKDENFMRVIDNLYEERLDDEHAANLDAAHEDHTINLEEFSMLDRTFVKWENIVLSEQVQKFAKKQRGNEGAMARSRVKGAHKKRRAHRKERMDGRESMTSSKAPMSARTHQSEARDSVSTEMDASMIDSMTSAQVENQLLHIDMLEELEKLSSTNEAFVVFQTEKARDQAVATCAGGVQFDGKTILVEVCPTEPSAVNWNRLTDRPLIETVKRVFLATGAILVALLIWCFCFYLPFASVVAKTDYAHGSDPDPLTKTMFGLVVVAGNAMMYFVCSEVSDRVGFKLQAQREVCYMLLYTFSCVFNVLLDLLMAYTMAYRTMVGLGVRTHDGRHLQDVDSFTDRFESYAMQKSLGQVLFDYSFPSTFLLPFLVEPFVVIIVPYQLMSLIIKANSSITGPVAEAYLSSCQMDLSRYADVILNLNLAVLMFFFPGGFILKIFIGLIISHIVIYLYDHSRVLRSIPACDYATQSVDWWAQWMLSFPCGALLACAIFKVNCDKEVLHCWDDEPIIWLCLAVFVGHVIVHTLVLLFIVPLFGAVTEPDDETYEVCARKHPCSWFSANPVFCLRSKYLHGDKPPCDYFILGKDHMMRQNPALHLHYKVPTPREENYSTRNLVMEASRNVGKKMSSLTPKAAAAVREAMFLDAAELDSEDGDAVSPLPREESVAAIPSAASAASGVSGKSPIGKSPLSRKGMSLKGKDSPPKTDARPEKTEDP